jgi:hypothetical protein
MSKKPMSKRWWLLMICAGLALTVSGCINSKSSENKAPSVTQQSATPSPLPAPKEVWMTGFQQINGTPYLYAPIYVANEEQKGVWQEIKQEIKSGGSSNDYESRKGSIDIRNYMFVHRDDLSASKLLPNNNARLLEMEEIGEKATPDKSAQEPNRIAKVQTLWYIKVTEDTNGDKVLNGLDRKQIAISDPSGANYTEIIKGIDKILLVQPKGLDRRLVIYAAGKKRFVADIDITKRQATTKELPSIN